MQDGITGLAVLDGAAKQSEEAVADAQRLLGLANDRYSGGLVAYLNVITAQQSLLNSRRQDAQIRGQQMTLSVALVKALGGGWDEGAAAVTAGPGGSQQSMQPNKQPTAQPNTQPHSQADGAIQTRAAAQ